MIERSITRLNHSFFLFGTRGTGKSTWLREKYKSAYYINLLNEGLFQSYLEDISLFYKSLKDLPSQSWVVIDEIQRLPRLLNEVHRLIEENKLLFALTGSSARKLKQSGVNLLAGRAITKYLYPFTPSELKEQFSLEKALQFGTLPLVWSSQTQEETLISYVQMYLKEEIKAEALVRNLEGFVRFLPVVALYHGQSLNISSMARDAGIKRHTAEGYVEILEDTLLVKRLPAYTQQLRVREKKHAKLYWVDSGIVRTAKKNYGTPSQEELGSLFEGLIFMMLQAEQSYRRIYDEIYYWSPAEAKKTEVDFLLVKGKEKIAIEVKYAKRIKPEHFKGLKAINGLKGLQSKILVYNGEHSFKTDDGIQVIHFSDWVKFLENLSMTGAC